MSSDLKSLFEKAADEVTKLSAPPNTDSMLKLYGMFKQIKDGNVKGDRPGMLQMEKRAKWDAWKKNEGLSADEAMKAYIDLVEKLKAEDAAKK